MKFTKTVVAIALGVCLFAGNAWSGPPVPGVTDLSAAAPQAIEAGDIVEALAVSRGTVIRPNARPTLRLPIYFELNSADLEPEAELLLEKLADALSSGDLETFRFSVEGHTDDLGEADYNESLSSRRAAAVKSYLLARGVSSERLQTVGHVEMVPVAPNQDGEGRRRNRRVEIINLGADG